MENNEGNRYWKEYTAFVRKEGALSDEWHIGEIIGATNGTTIRLYLCPLITRGASKGEPNFRKAKSKITVVLSTDKLFEFHNKFAGGN